MPDPTCPAGSRQIDSTQVWAWVPREAVEDALGDWAFLLNWAPNWLTGFPRLLGDLCATTPTGPFDLTDEQLEEAASDPIALYQLISDVIQNRIDWYLWSNYCECIPTALLPGEQCFDETAALRLPRHYYKLNEASGTTADDSVGTWDAPYAGGYTLGATGPFSGSTAAQFGATAGRVQADPVVVPTAKWAIAAWIHPTTYHTSPGNQHTIAYLGTGDVPGNESQLHFYVQAINATSGVLRSYTGRSGGNTAHPNGGSVPVNAWTFVVMSYDNDGVLRQYINGALDASDTLAGGGDLAGSSAGRFLIGYHPGTANNQFNGRIGRVWVGPPLSASDVAAMYAAALTDCDIETSVPIDELTEPVIPPGYELPPATPTCSLEQLCADMSLVMVNLRAVAENVRVIQSQAAPFAYQLGQTFAGLTGSGSVAVRATLGARVDITTLPTAYGSILANPTVLIDIGWVSFSTADGYLPAQRLTHDNLLLLPPTPGIITGVNYSLRPGVVVSITALERLR